ncbi:MAG: T9SS type A sorting domain-containing protein [Bacteroidota bacterium]
MIKSSILLPIFLTIGLAVLVSQDWTIVNPEYAYHYIGHNTFGQETDSLNPFTLEVDRISGDTSWMTHRLVEMHGWSDPDFVPVPFFLQYEMIQRGDQSVWFRDTGSFVIYPPSPSLTSWLFDTLANITATQASVFETMTYQQSDSVRLLLLSSGDTILQSKHFGMLRFPDGYGNDSYFRQLGIDGAERGFNYPDFYEMYAWQAGDRYEYKTTKRYERAATYSHADTCHTVTTIRQMDILAVDTISEGLAIKILDKVHIGDTTYNTWFHQYVRQEANSYAYVHWDTLFKDDHPFYFWEDDPNPVLSKPHEVPDFSGSYPYQQIAFLGNGAYHPSHFVEYFYPSSGQLKHRLTKRLTIGDCGFGNQGTPAVLPKSFSCSFAWIDWRGNAWWSKGLGLVSSHSELPELHTQFQDAEYNHRLMAYQQGDSTFGTFSPASFFPVGIEDSKGGIRFQLYPNPARDRIFLKSLTDTPFFQVEILDLMGKVLRRASFSGQGRHEMAMEDMAAGIYLVKLTELKSGDTQGIRLLIRE